MNESMKRIGGDLAVIHVEVLDMKRWHEADSILNLEGSFLKAEERMAELKAKIDFAKTVELKSRNMDVEEKTMMVRLLDMAQGVANYSTGKYAGECADLLRSMKAKLEGRNSPENEACLRLFLLKDWDADEMEVE